MTRRGTGTARPPRDGADTTERIEAIMGRLRGNGGRLTTGRRAVVQALLAAGDEHVTADDLAVAVQADHPHVHLSTVYRTLDALEAIGAVDRVAMGAGVSVYHLADRAHHHLVCKRCGAVADVPDEFVASLSAELEQRYGFAVEHPHLVISGRCRNCRGDA